MLNGEPVAEMQPAELATVPVIGAAKYSEKHSETVTPDDLELQLTGEDKPEADNMD